MEMFWHIFILSLLTGSFARKIDVCSPDFLDYMLYKSIQNINFFDEDCENDEKYFQEQCKIRLENLHSHKSEFQENFEHCGDIQKHTESFQEGIDMLSFYCSLEYELVDCKDLSKCETRII